MRRNRRSNNSDESNKNSSPAWMTTFGDMMTLLLVFFVLIYSFSVMDLQKFKGFISALQNQLGVLDGGKTISDESKLTRGSRGTNYNQSEVNLTRLKNRMQTFITEKGLEDKVQMEITERGLEIRMTGEILYDLGEARIKKQGREVLDEIATSIKDIRNDVMVEGHTDNLPINNERFPSNWELSTTRATNVIRYFIEEHDIKPYRLSAAGYSEFRPLFDNDTPEHRAKNRRIEIVVKNTWNQTG